MASISKEWYEVMEASNGKGSKKLESLNRAQKHSIRVLVNNSYAIRSLLKMIYDFYMYAMHSSPTTYVDQNHNFYFKFKQP